MKPPSREEKFRLAYAEHFDALLGYALRRSGREEDAADLVADSQHPSRRPLEDR